MLEEPIKSLFSMHDGQLRTVDINRVSCPACYGEDFCHRVQFFRRSPEVGRLIFGNAKGVHIGWLLQPAEAAVRSLSATPADAMVIAKSLAFDSELRRADQDLCEEAKGLGLYAKSCIDMPASDAGKISVAVAKKIGNFLGPFYNVSNHGTPNLAECAGPMIHKRLVTAYDDDKDGQLSAHEAAFLRTTLTINIEPAILKVCNGICVYIHVALIVCLDLVVVVVIALDCLQWHTCLSATLVTFLTFLDFPAYPILFFP